MFHRIFAPSSPMLTPLFTTPPHLHFRDVQAEKESPNRVNVKAEVGEQLFKIRGYQWSVFQLWSIRDPVVLQRRPLNSGGISSVLEAITLPFEAKCKDMQSEKLVSTSVHRCFVWRAKRLRVSQFHKILTHAMACFARHVVVESGISYFGTSANWIQFIRFMIGGSYMCEFLDEKPCRNSCWNGAWQKGLSLVVRRR